MSWPWHSPVLRHICLQYQGASLPCNGRLGHLLLHMQLEIWALGALVSSYCCSTYRVADPFSSLGTYSSSSIGGPVIHPRADCEHPLLCLLGPSIAPQETAISGSFQQNLAGVCNGVSVWRLLICDQDKFKKFRLYCRIWDQELNWDFWVSWSVSFERENSTARGLRLYMPQKQA